MKAFLLALMVSPLALPRYSLRLPASAVPALHEIGTSISVDDSLGAMHEAALTLQRSMRTVMPIGEFSEHVANFHRLYEHCRRQGLLADAP